MILEPTLKDLENQIVHFAFFRWTLCLVEAGSLQGFHEKHVLINVGLNEIEISANLHNTQFKGTVTSTSYGRMQATRGHRKT